MITDIRAVGRKGTFWSTFIFAKFHALQLLKGLYVFDIVSGLRDTTENSKITRFLVYFHLPPTWAQLRQGEKLRIVILDTKWSH